MEEKNINEISKIILEHPSNMEFENLRLTKNSNGDYQWTFVIKYNTLSIDSINRLQKLNDEIKKRFEKK